MATVEALDTEISDIRTRIATLRAHRANLSTILLSQPRLPTRLSQRPVQQERKRRAALKHAQAQSKRNLENIYRACAGVTAYKVQDPDPCAVDNGNVLGVRVDVSVGNRFVETYHVLFNRPDPERKNMLRIHKHTVPPCIPLQPLANKWLPVARKDDAEVEQDLVRFGRALRKELVSWHLRQDALEKLRAEAGLAKEGDARQEKRQDGTEISKVLNAFVSDDEDDEDEEELRRAHEGPARITEMEADTAVRELTILWSTGSRGVVRVGKDGEIEKAVFRSREGLRDTGLGRKALGRIEGLVQRLLS